MRSLSVSPSKGEDDERLSEHIGLQSGKQGIPLGEKKRNSRDNLCQEERTPCRDRRGCGGRPDEVRIRSHGQGIAVLSRTRLLSEYRTPSAS